MHVLRNKTTYDIKKWQKQKCDTPFTPRTEEPSLGRWLATPIFGTRSGVLLASFGVLLWFVVYKGAEIDNGSGEEEFARRVNVSSVPGETWRKGGACWCSGSQRLHQEMDQDPIMPDTHAGASQHVEGAEAADRDDGGNPVAQLQSQILELGQKHDQVLSALANMSNACTRSYVYIPRERQIVPFSGDCCADNQTVDEFIDEIERVIRVRGLNSADQVDFILSHLRGSALDEIKLCMGREMKQPQELFSYLRGAFREKRTTPQLLHAFYARRQLDGEHLRDYSHSLSQLLNAALQQSSTIVSDPQLALRDQFIEGVRDPTLRRELRRLVRERPQCTLFDVRDEAMMWYAEDKPRSANVARSRNISSEVDVSEQVNSSCTVPNELAVTLQEVVKVITQQGKAIGELTEAVRELTMQKASVLGKSTKPKFRPKYTDDGQPICLRCEGVGHVARTCTAPHGSKAQSSSASASAVPGKGVPPLQ
ncbi:hypothetical protein QQF64_018443 [Cirrhinus molitorella]|uniref:Paraneoplastic antigen Ma-like C-terminal domain-containing protein n=1 Tax=Cirrhinus molitorella TaxID=172907 RepID=A0ABR3LG36_9TELE